MIRMRIYLHNYLQYGGKLEKLPVEDCVLEISDVDKNHGKKILSIEELPSRLVKVTFEDGVTENYGTNWIVVEVDFQLDSKYL